MAVQTGKLLVVATPIGNLGDLSPRATDALANADILACEDTCDPKLISLCGIDTGATLLPYHDHNGHRMRPKLLAALLANGKIVALVSDAGTPLVSDPGYKLVTACHSAGITISAIPGRQCWPDSLLPALQANKFLFAGYVPVDPAAAAATFREFADLAVTSIWFDTPKQAGQEPAELMHEIFGNRLAVVARELTKLYEEYQRDDLGVLANNYSAIRNKRRNRDSGIRRSAGYPAL